MSLYPRYTFVKRELSFSFSCCTVVESVLVFSKTNLLNRVGSEKPVHSHRQGLHMRKIKGKNSISSKQYNRGLILRLIATQTCHTRVELARATGLTKMTVTNIVSEYIEKGILEESEAQETELRGRNPMELCISKKAPKLVGLLIFRDRITAVLCDFQLKVLAREEIGFTDLTKDQLTEYSFLVVDRILEREKNILGIGVAVIGPVDIKQGILLNPVRFYGIEKVPILEILRKRYSYPIYLDHDNNSAALAEKLYGSGKDVQDFLFLGISNGIGSGVVIHGEVYHNQMGLETEIGHVSIDYRGEMCSCGNRGCLEVYACTHVLLERFRRETGMDEAFSYFCHVQGNPVIDQIWEDILQKIGAVLISSVNLLHPEKIILGHDCMEWEESYLHRLEDIIHEKKVVQGRKRILVQKAHFGKDAQLVGAAANVMIQVFQGNLLL